MENNESGFYDRIAKVTRTRGKIADPFDAAGALLGGVIGFIVVDIPALHIGIPPGTGAALGASAAVGVVQGVKGWLNVRGNIQEGEIQALAAEEERKKNHLELEADAENFRKLLVEEKNEKLLGRLDRLLKSRYARVWNDKQFSDRLEKLKTEYGDQYESLS